MSTKMTKEHLAYLQALPLQLKIKKTELRIKEWYEYWEGDVFLSFSGGKDSTVLLDIARRLYPDIEAVFSDTGLEYPEIKEFVKTFPNVTVVRPKHSFKQILTKYGYPIISKEVANVVEGARRWIVQVQNGGGSTYQNTILTSCLDEKSLRSPVTNVGGAETLQTLNKLAMQKPTLGGADRLYRQLNGLGEYKKNPVTLRTGAILGILDRNNNISTEIAEGQKSMYSQEKWKFLLGSDFKISDKCCYHMKKSPLEKYSKKTGKKPIVATMTEESRMRKSAWLKTGCNAYTGKQISKPMSFWKEQDILEYIDVMGLDVAPVYGNLLYSNGKYFFDGCQRTGCIFCGFGCHLEHEPNRFQRLKETHPKLYDYCMGGGEYNEDGIWQPSNKGLGMKHVMNFIGVNTD